MACIAPTVTVQKSFSLSDTGPGVVLEWLHRNIHLPYFDLFTVSLIQCGPTSGRGSLLYHTVFLV